MCRADLGQGPGPRSKFPYHQSPITNHHHLDPDDNGTVDAEHGTEEAVTTQQHADRSSQTMHHPSSHRFHAHHVTVLRGSEGCHLVHDRRCELDARQ